MSGTQCEYVYPSGQPCGNEAIQKCTGLHCNGGVYCVKHIQYLNSQYICDICIRETERVKRERAEAVAREARVAAFERSIHLAQEKSKIRRPRRLILFSLVLVAASFILALILAPLGARFPQDGQPAISGGSMVAFIDFGIAVLGSILFIIAWIWVIIIALRRGQTDWALFLVFAGGLALPLYLIFNPVTAD